MNALHSPFRQHFPQTRGYLAACTAGIPSLKTVAASHAFIDGWAAGSLDVVSLGESFERCRGLFAQIADVPTDRVAVGSQVSQIASTVATAVPDGAEVLCAEGDFASLVHPFEQLAHRGVRVRYAPIAQLAAAIGPDTGFVVFSLAQSATGVVADHETIARAAAAVGARTFVDTTQSAGWLPVSAANFDFTVCHAYKWLCAPRGTAFLTVREGLEDTLVPLAAGWYSAGDVWESCYSSNMPLSPGAGRFDLSPAWPSVAGTEAALQLFAELDITQVHAHNVGLANAARVALDLAPAESAIVTWADPDGSDLAAMQAAGVTASGRAGNARIAFHLWNDENDLAMLVDALGR